MTKALWTRCDIEFTDKDGAVVKTVFGVSFGDQVTISALLDFGRASFPSSTTLNVTVWDSSIGRKERAAARSSALASTASTSTCRARSLFSTATRLATFGSLGSPTRQVSPSKTVPPTVPPRLRRWHLGTQASCRRRFYPWQAGGALLQDTDTSITLTIRYKFADRLPSDPALILRITCKWDSTSEPVADFTPDLVLTNMTRSSLTCPSGSLRPTASWRHGHNQVSRGHVYEDGAALPWQERVIHDRVADIAVVACPAAGAERSARSWNAASVGSQLQPTSRRFGWLQPSVPAALPKSPAAPPTTTPRRARIQRPGTRASSRRRTSASPT